MNYASRDVGVQAPFPDVKKSPFSIPLQEGYSTQSDTLTSAETRMVGQGVGAAAQAGASLIGGLAQNAERRRAANESRYIADIQRDDQLNQQKVNNRLRAKAQEQEEQLFELQKRKVAFETRYNTFIKVFQENLG